MKKRFSFGSGLNVLMVLLSLGGISNEARADDVSVSWNGARALKDIQTLVAFGPRAEGTPGLAKARDFIVAVLRTAGIAEPLFQKGTITTADGTVRSLVNLIGRWNPEAPRRIILATHYDSIVRAYRDKRTPDAPMPGANNGGSGVAVLLETLRVLHALPKPLTVGVDFVFFDGEEGPAALGAGDPHWSPLGSTLFAHEQLDALYPTGQRPEGAVVVDMVCDRDLALRPEGHSLQAAPKETRRFWDIGTRLAPSAFTLKPTRFPINDDHVPLIQAGIPAFLVIDFDYEPFYNTTADTPDKCSTTSLEAVGRTLTAYLTGL